MTSGFAAGCPRCHPGPRRRRLRPVQEGGVRQEGRVLPELQAGGRPPGASQGARLLPRSQVRTQARSQVRAQVRTQVQVLR